jgi:hypothetical protein
VIMWRRIFLATASSLAVDAGNEKTSASVLSAEVEVNLSSFGDDIGTPCVSIIIL